MALLAMPVTVTLSVTRTFISAPLRDFTVSSGPLTASIAPRIRTVGVGWADAADAKRSIAASEATSARGRNEQILGMAVPPKVVFTKANVAKANVTKSEHRSP